MVLRHFSRLDSAVGWLDACAVGWTEAEKSRLVSIASWVVIGASIAGNFLAAVLARWMKYRRAIACLCVGYCLSMTATYVAPLNHNYLWVGFVAIGLCQGVFALFTMYMPPLFPTLLRTTGAGFCYNIGRIAAGLGTVFFGLVANVGDYRVALLCAGFLFLPAAGIALLLPEPPDEKPPDLSIAKGKDEHAYQEGIQTDRGLSGIRLPGQ